MEKLDGKSMDIVEQNIEQLKQLFPEVFSEGKIKFDHLQELLGNYVVEDEDHYSFTWHGKRKAGRLAKALSTATLRPCKEESVAWDTTQNLFIEGDNLEVLKLLQKSYHCRVKMIYIDPPYNTGGDFIYEDDFKDGVTNYLEMTGQLNGAGKKMGTNSSSAGRYHTNWLNMMYPRLRLARNLLRDDGVIFISIDDNEQANLRKLCDEVFGEENVDTMIWRKAGLGRDGKMKNTTTYRKDHEYILVCFKDIKKLNKTLSKPEWENKYGNPDNDPRGGYKAGSISKKEEASNENSPNYYTITSPSGKEFTRQFDISQNEFLNLNKDNRIYWGKNLDSVPAIKIFQNEEREVNTSSIFFKDQNEFSSSLFEDNKVNTTSGTKEIDRILNVSEIGKEMRSKPSELIRKLIQIGSDKNDIVLDFFAGTGTTGQSMFLQNIKDACGRKFIMVQLPEPTGEKHEAYKAGYKNIADIAKERIRRAAKKIKDESPHYNGDLGFKVLKLDSSNIKRWEANFDTLKNDLLDAVDYIKKERSNEDMLYELLLKYGLELTVPIEERVIAGKNVYSIGLGTLIVCLEKDICMNVVKGIRELKEELKPEIMRVVLKDDGFKDDVVKTNTIQTLKNCGIEDIKSL